MAIERWSPRRDATKQEEMLLSRLGRTRKLLGFLRRHRHEIFDDAFQAELESMYRGTGAGKEPVVPALMAMAMLVQGYLGMSDAEMVELTVVDLRVQMVLDCLGATKTAFSQGAFCDFRARMIKADMDRRLLERTAELCRSTKEFDQRKLPKTLRVAVDSSPFEGAGRVEDTFNLLAHAARNVMRAAAALLGWTEQRTCSRARVPLLLESSVKRGLDTDWNSAEDKAEALRTLVVQLDLLQSWVEKEFPAELRSTLDRHIQVLAQIRKQDLEEDSRGAPRIRQGVAEDRRVSIEDADMRHGRKSKSKRFNGYKRHIAADIDGGVILAAAVTPANRPEEMAAPELKADIDRQGLVVSEWHLDRGYISSSVVDDALRRRAEVLCKPWRSRNGDLFAKTAFRLNLRDRTITCPAGQTKGFELGTAVEFDADLCDHCPQRARCTTAELGQGRTVSIAENEQLQQRLRKLIATPKGRERLRERVTVEHRLAHISQRQGNRARYKGLRKNNFDLRRACALQNLETLHRMTLSIAEAKAA